MNKEERQAQILSFIHEEIIVDSDFVGKIINQVTYSLRDSLRTIRTQATDYEAALIMMFSRETDFAKEKINKWEGNHFFAGWEERIDKEIKISVKRKK